MEGDQIHPENTKESDETSEEEANGRAKPEAIDLSKPFDLFNCTEEEMLRETESFMEQWHSNNERAMAGASTEGFYSGDCGEDYFIHLVASRYKLASQRKRSECPKAEGNREAKLEDATGQDEWNIDSVLKELGEGGEGNEKQGKTKKSKSKKSKKNNQRQTDSTSKNLPLLKVTNNAEAGSKIETKDSSEDGDCGRKIENVDLKCVEEAATTDEVVSQNQAGGDQEKELRLDNDLVSFPDPLAFGSELVNREAKLHDLLESHIHLVTSKGAEMSQIINKLDNAEEEKSALDKETEKLDAAANELQEKREQLELRKLSNAKNLRKFGEKKKKLEKYLDKVTSEHQITKEQLERDIDELKIYIDSNNVEVLNVEKSLDWKNEWLESIESKIADKKKELECPVCLEVASPPIFCCDAQHVICRVCKPKVPNCPECRKPYGENLRRHRFAEKAANDLSELEKEREKILKIVEH